MQFLTYRIAAKKELPVIGWDFAFAVSRKRNEFGSQKRKNQFNVCKEEKKAAKAMIENRNINIINNTNFSA